MRMRRLNSMDSTLVPAADRVCPRKKYPRTLPSSDRRHVDDERSEAHECERSTLGHIYH